MRHRFGRHSTAARVLKALDLSNTVFLVTGCASGIGFETMRALAARGAHVVGTARSLSRATEACHRVDGRTTPIACEQDDFDSVAQAAHAIAALNVRFDAVILNAGIMAPPQPDLRYGVEGQFRVNHLSHMLLALRIAPLIKDELGRLVVVSSAAQRVVPRAGIDLDNLDAHDGYSPWRFYGQAKLANCAFAKSMAERLAPRGIVANALHPGVITGTDLARTLPTAMRLAWPLARLFGKSIAQGAATQCFLAAHPDAAGLTGGYFANCRPATPHPKADDPLARESLWRVSETVIAKHAPPA